MMSVVENKQTINLVNKFGYTKDYNLNKLSLSCISFGQIEIDKILRELQATMKTFLQYKT